MFSASKKSFMCFYCAEPSSLKASSLKSTFWTVGTALKSSHSGFWYQFIEGSVFIISRVSLRERCSMSQLNTRRSANIPLKADHTFNLEHLTALNNEAIGKLWKKTAEKYS